MILSKSLSVLPGLLSDFVRCTLRSTELRKRTVSQKNQHSNVSLYQIGKLQSAIKQ